MPRPQRARDFTLRELRDGEVRPEQCAQRHCLSGQSMPVVLITYNYPRLRSVVTRRLYCCAACAARFRRTHSEVVCE